MRAPGPSCNREPGSTTKYAGTVHLYALPFPARSITIKGYCKAAPEHPAMQTYAGTGVDVAPPDEVGVTTPRTWQGQVQVAETEQGLTVTIVGTAHDLQSGMVGGLASVTLALSPQTPPEQRTKARPAATPTTLRTGRRTSKYRLSARLRFMCGRPTPLATPPLRPPRGRSRRSTCGSLTSSTTGSAQVNTCRT